LAARGLRPDLVGWRTEKHPAPPRKVNVGERHFGVYVTPPDWVCEVLSPSTRSRDEDNGLKWQTYWQAGVGHYWLLDLVRSQLTVYGRGERDYEPIDVAGRASVKALAPFEGAEVDARRVFLPCLSGCHPSPGGRLRRAASERSPRVMAHLRAHRGTRTHTPPAGRASPATPDATPTGAAATERALRVAGSARTPPRSPSPAGSSAAARCGSVRALAAWRAPALARGGLPGAGSALRGAP